MTQMTEPQQQRALELLRDFLGIHLFGREEVRKVLSKRENDSYSVLARKIYEFVKEVDSVSS